MHALSKDKRILIVDRDEHLVRGLASLFEDAGACVSCALDGLAAVEVAERDCPHVIILGTRLPKRSGHLVLEKLKLSDRATGDRPIVIMISDLKGVRHRRWAEALGACMYVQKPVQLPRLRDAVERLLAE